jgi:enoyl-CoA hydratase/methylglutaconyl-CoA hydratase
MQERSVAPQTAGDGASYSHILYTVQAGVAELTLNRPQRLNAFHLPMYREICDALARAASDDHVRVVLLRGAGRAFCTGRDLTYSADLQVEEDPSVWRREYKLFTAWTLLNHKMIVSLVQGYALGGGASLALGADVTLAATGAQVGYPETRHGIASKTMVWAWVLGAKVAKEVVATGRFIKVEDAMHLGLVNRVVSEDQLLETGRAVAKDIAEAPVGVPELVKRMVNYARRDQIQVMYDDRKFDVDTAFWDAAGVEPSPWLLRARATREAFLDRIAEAAASRKQA